MSATRRPKEGMFLTEPGFLEEAAVMFRDRYDAGRQLAEELARYAGASETIVLGIPRGGVVVAGEVARRLDLPLDIVLASKIGAPGSPEYAVGAVTPDGDILANPEARYDLVQLEHLALDAKDKIARRSKIYRAGREPLELASRRVLIIDDGIATGLTAEAAIAHVKRSGASEVILAVPVVSRSALVLLEEQVDSLVAVERPDVFYAVGQYYRRFEQTSDDEVIDILSAR